VLSLPPLSLYVHLPWCARKCPYCDFNSHQSAGEPPFEAYVDALLDDLSLDLPWAQGRECQTIFIGGGTPSLFPGAAIRRLLAGVRERLPLAEDAEITLEANPGSAEAARFAAYREAGVNRLSIGVQSFDDRSLAALGRVHDAGAALHAVSAARAAGFSNINLDLMHGLPGQDAAAAALDLATAIAQGVPHLSWYQLTIEPNTVFHSRPPVLPVEDELAGIQLQGEEQLARAGYGQYEVSAYAQPGHRCRHNLNYWGFGDYLGIGAGAHGKISLPQEGRVIRSRRSRVPKDYLAALPAARRDVSAVDADELPLEFLMNALRLNEGVAAGDFEARTGIALAQLDAELSALRSKGLLVEDTRRLRTTPTGFRFLDSVLSALA
jgi:putative oxygen-independent coproporphyrinogen III oxidase